jgi:hypothetical protein
VDTAVANMMQGDLAYHAGRRERRTVWRLARIWTLILGCGAILYGSAMMFMLPFFNMRVFEGTSISVIACLVWAIYAASELRVMPKIILEVFGSLRAIAVISAVSAVIGMTTVAAILAVAPPQWSLIGALASEILALLGFWSVLIYSMDTHPSKRQVGQERWKAS